jgi:hypothetical protein
MYRPVPLCDRATHRAEGTLVEPLEVDSGFEPLEALN